VNAEQVLDSTPDLEVRDKREWLHNVRELLGLQSSKSATRAVFGIGVATAKRFLAERARSFSMDAAGRRWQRNRKPEVRRLTIS